MLWTSVSLEPPAQFEQSVDKLVQTVLVSVPDAVAGAGPALVQAELVSELERLNNDITAAGKTERVTDSGDAWQDEPARLHSIIPELPPDFRCVDRNRRYAD